MRIKKHCDDIDDSNMTPATKHSMFFEIKSNTAQQRWGFGTKHAFQDQTWIGQCST